MTQVAHSDAELLAEFTRTRSAQVFAAIVERYVDLVHATARRLVGDHHLADDVAQAAFLVLIRKAGQIEPKTLAGWLVNTTRLAAKEAIRAKLCRERHEAQAAMKQAATASPDADGHADLLRITPLLDEALARLADDDRTAVVLRFLQGKSFADVAAATGTTEEGARKRVTRAIEKLRVAFTSRGIVAGIGVLMLALATQQASAAPAAVTAAIAALPATGGSAISAKLAHDVIQAVRWAKVKIVLGVAAGLLALAIFGSLLAGGTRAGSSRFPPPAIAQTDPGPTGPTFAVVPALPNTPPQLRAIAKTFEWQVIPQSPAEFAAAAGTFIALGVSAQGEIRTEPTFILAVRLGDSALIATLKAHQPFEPERRADPATGRARAIAPATPLADWTWLPLPNALGASTTQAHVTIGGEFPVVDHLGKSYFIVTLLDGNADTITIEIRDGNDSKQLTLERDHPLYVTAGGADLALVFPTVYAASEGEVKSQIPKDQATLIVARLQ